MTVEEVKARLRRYNNLRCECRKLRQEIERRHSDMAALRAVKTDAVPGSRGNSIEAAIEKIDALERRLRCLECDADTARADAETLIELVDCRDGYNILRLRYLDGVRFEEIPDRLSMSSATMWRKYREALREINEEIQKKLKNDSEMIQSFQFRRRGRAEIQHVPADGGDRRQS